MHLWTSLHTLTFHTVTRAWALSAGLGIVRASFGLRLSFFKTLSGGQEISLKGSRIASGSRSSGSGGARGGGKPRDRTPVGAHGGEPEAVDVSRQAAEEEDTTGEIQRDHGPVICAIGWADLADKAKKTACVSG